MKFWIGFSVCLISLCFAALVFADVDCLTCHKDLSEGKDVHPAVMMGCTACHTGVDASQVPHKFTGAKLGLSAEPPELCFGCHKKEAFEDKFVHAPVSMGMCTTCHNPHKSEQEKLLVSPVPDLCFTCHEKDRFQKKDIHPPVKEGKCLGCHATHAGPNERLVLKKGILLCRQCHANVEREPHMIAGFRAGGHPVHGRKDPIRKGKPFECLSCHVPHSSDWGKLFRYEGSDAFSLCNYCHVY